jgi:hypothetical protein
MMDGRPYVAYFTKTPSKLVEHNLLAARTLVHDRTRGWDLVVTYSIRINLVNQYTIKPLCGMHPHKYMHINT